MGMHKYANEFRITLHEDALGIPLKWKKPRLIFVNSMSDLFHERVPDSFIYRVFDIMRTAHWHQFQVLTKRSERLAEMSRRLNWAPNIWMGVSVESSDYLFRISHLRSTKAHIKFLSLEPLLGPLPRMSLGGINWAIVGGESGPGARPMKEEWVLQIKDKCAAAGVAFFFKQWGGPNKKRAGRLLDGKTWNELPIQPPSGASSRKAQNT